MRDYFYVKQEFTPLTTKLFTELFSNTMYLLTVINWLTKTKTCQENEYLAKSEHAERAV